MNAGDYVTFRKVQMRSYALATTPAAAVNLSQVVTVIRCLYTAGGKEQLTASTSLFRDGSAPLLDSI